jgi:hypothetical protein
MKTPSVAWAWIIWVLAAALASSAAGAGDNPSPLAGSDDNPAIARFGRSIILYVSFDGHTFAEITQGAAKPTVNAQWAAVAKDATRLYAPGVFGQGLRSGTHQLVFTSPKSTLGTTGSMALWLKPEELHHRGTYCWPVILDALEGRYRVMFGRMGDPANRELLYAYLSHAKGSVTVTQQSMSDWRPGRWHLFAATWDSNSVGFSVDGSPSSRASLRAPIRLDAAGGLRVWLLAKNEDLFVYDEFLALDIPLGNEDIRWLYEQGIKRVQP